MDEKKCIKLGLGTVICIFIIILLLAISIILLYKVKYIERSSNLAIENLKLEKDILENANNSNKYIENNLVETTMNNTADTNSDVDITYIKKLSKNGTLTLPQINEDTEGAKSINEKINKLYSLDKIYGVCNTVVCTELLEYKNKNLIGIFLNLETRTDNGIVYYFYYDLDTKKEFTLKDIIENEGFSLSDINNKYQKTLDSLAESWDGENNIMGRDYTITGEEMFYTNNEYSEEVGHYVNALNIVIPIDKAYCLMNGKTYSVRIPYKYIEGYFQF